MFDNFKLVMVVSIVILATTLVGAICIGAVSINPLDAISIVINKTTNSVISLFTDKISIAMDPSIKSATETIVWDIRLPRILLALVTGGTLSLAGATYQSLLKNPMADPFVIGVSSGAAFGAAVAISTGITFSVLGISFITICAFISSIGVIMVVYSIARIGKKVPVVTLLLSGIAMGNFLSAFTSLIMIFSGDDLQKIYFWTMGSLNGNSWDQLLSLLPIVILGSIVVFIFSKDLNIILMGEDTASNLGVNVEKVKTILLATSTIITASVVSVTGIIGFVGLIIPHISRMIIGPNNKKLIPLSFVLGGILLIICDTIARSLLSQEIPVGLITSILGGPFFIYLLRRRKKDII